MNSSGYEKSDFFREVKKLIIDLRRKKNSIENWAIFRALIEENPEFTCSALDTRWLVSIADTYADYGNDIEKRNALYISMLVNFEKLSATRLLIYDLTINKIRLELLKKNRVIPLWDGMYSFNVNRGDMSMNLFYRIRTVLEDTPFLKLIFEEVLNRLLRNETVLSNLNAYHKKMFDKPKKHSIVKGILRKIRFFFRDNRLL